MAGAPIRSEIEDPSAFFNERRVQGIPLLWSYIADEA